MTQDYITKNPKKFADSTFVTKKDVIKLIKREVQKGELVPAFTAPRKMKVYSETTEPAGTTKTRKGQIGTVGKWYSTPKNDWIDLNLFFGDYTGEDIDDVKIYLDDLRRNEYAFAKTAIKMLNRYGDKINKKGIILNQKDFFNGFVDYLEKNGLSAEFNINTDEEDFPGEVSYKSFTIRDSNGDILSDVPKQSTKGNKQALEGFDREAYKTRVREVMTQNPGMKYREAQKVLKGMKQRF